jgi:hypothetical protein
MLAVIKTVTTASPSVVVEEEPEIKAYARIP